MRCIEILPPLTGEQALLRLTLTWDVLKSMRLKYLWTLRIWLTLTWDVLKYTGISASNAVVNPININMRCIEMIEATVRLHHG